MLEFVQFILSTILFFVVLFCITFVIMFFKNLRKFQEQTRLQEENENNTSPIMLVYFEKVDNMLHMYDRLSNYFVAHGKDENEMWERAQLRYPNVNLILADGDMSNLTVLTQRIKNEE